MGLQETIQTLKTYYELPAALSFLGGKVRFFQEVTQKINSECQLLVSNSSLAGKQNILNDVKSSIVAIKQFILEKPIDIPSKNFMMEFCLLVSNWNDNASKNTELSSDIKLMTRYCQQHYTMLELLEYVKSVTTKLRSYENYALPTIELSRHYLASMDTPGGSTTKPVVGPGAVRRTIPSRQNTQIVELKPEKPEVILPVIIDMKEPVIANDAVLKTTIEVVTQFPELEKLPIGNPAHSNSVEIKKDNEIKTTPLTFTSVVK